jgi:DNA-binding MarR family transcriptional regulator
MPRAPSSSPKVPVSRKARRGRLPRLSRKRTTKKAASDRVPPARLGRLSDQVGYLLRRASNVFTSHWALQFAREEMSITPVQCGMLILVDENPGLTQIELARLLKVEGSTLWQLVDRLLKLGFIRRRRVPDDRRAFAIHLSQAGRKALQRIERGLRQHQRALLACLSEAERASLTAMLTRVIDAGDRLNEKVGLPTRKAAPAV